MKKILLIVVLILLAAAFLLGRNIVSFQSIPMLLNAMTGQGIDSPDAATVETRLQVPNNFGLSVYASDLPNARFITMTTNRDLLITRPHKGDVVMLRADSSNPRQGGERTTLLEGLNKPSGIAVHDGWLFIGETDAIGRIAFDQSTGKTSGDYQRIVEGLTSDGNHPYKQVKIGPDGKLYLSQGSTCNVCEELDPRRSTLSRFNIDGTGEEILATGLRNTMGFDWAPWSNELYATDNGRDLLGDDYPPCELNLIEEGKFYGWPYFNGANEPDPDFGFDVSDQSVTASGLNPIAPAHEFRAHNAPLGITFVNTEAWSEDYKKMALVALHGSWNRSIPDGYRVVSLHWQGDEIISKDFFSGFEKAGDVIGRPVDVTQGPDGAVYISDDYAGSIYRIAYGEIQKPIVSKAPVEIKKEFVLVEPDWLTDANRSVLAERGSRLFKQFGCKGCHISKGAPGRMDLSTVNQRLQYTGVIARLTKPRSPMPTFPLTEEDKKALATFLMERAKTQ